MLSFLPKLVGFAAILQIFPLVLRAAGGSTQSDASAILFTALAVLTMTFGNIMALRQKNVLRLLAWSSISHGGYMLVGVALSGAAVAAGAVSEGISALLFYLPVYGIMSIGVFAILSASGARQPLRSLEDLHGLSQTNPASALMLAVCVFGLSGLPPTGGFLWKTQPVCRSVEPGRFSQPTACNGARSKRRHRCRLLSANHRTDVF
jgi:NADH-quinone oxidoreductase subunit N